MVLAGRYRVDRPIGEGGMGRVFAGVHLSMGLAVAIKSPAAAAQADPESLARFRREAHLLGRVRSDAVARVVDFFDDAEHGLLLVMEYVRGVPLARTLAERGHLEVEEVIEIGAALAAAVADLHRAQVIHRDLKPGNVLLEPRPDGSKRLVIVDFGAGRILNEPDEGGEADEAITNITRADMAIGTMEYMAPEQMLNSRDVTAACDLYAIGAMLYRAAAGAHVYGALTTGKLVRAKLLDDAPRLRTGRDDAVAAGLAAVVARALRRQPQERQPSAAVMAAELAALLEMARPKRASSPPPVRRAPEASAAVDASPRSERPSVLPRARFEVSPVTVNTEVSRLFRALVAPEPPAPGIPAPRPSGDALPFELVPRDAMLVSAEELIDDDDGDDPVTARRQSAVGPGDAAPPSPAAARLGAPFGALPPPLGRGAPPEPPPPDPQPRSLQQLATATPHANSPSLHPITLSADPPIGAPARARRPSHGFASAILAFGVLWIVAGAAIRMRSSTDASPVRAARPVAAVVLPRARIAAAELAARRGEPGTALPPGATEISSLPDVPRGPLPGRAWPAAPRPKEPAAATAHSDAVGAAANVANAAAGEDHLATPDAAERALPEVPADSAGPREVAPTLDGAAGEAAPVAPAGAPAAD
jgi:serine/threonine-protein kinase